jgi:esterase/lipase superfamily enzyme
MGNRLLFSTVDRLIEAHQAGTLRARIGQVILAAADVAAPLFSPRAPSYRRLATRRITSYSCKQDLALRISRQLHGHSRVGLEPPVFVCPGIDSVSAAELDLHALGHSYYAETQTVVYDIADLIHNDTPPETRMRLEPSSSRLYWILR